MPMDRENLSAIGLAASRTVTGRSRQRAGQGLFAQRTSDCAAVAYALRPVDLVVWQFLDG
jgi:hypothetical protein